MTFKIGIVGTSKVDNPTVEKTVLDTVNKFMKINPNIELVSGGAKGVDNIAERIAKQLNIPIKIFPPKFQNLDSFRERNLLIAEYSDIVLSFALPYDNNPSNICYHCNEITPTHIRTGGCWTTKFARMFGKTGETIILHTSK